MAGGLPAAAQTHWPLALHVLPPLHLTQAEPFAPQLFLSVGLMQALPLQQPAQPLVVSQTQVPDEQRRPCPHGGLVGPQRQAPLMQRSALASHAAQDPPAPPHAASVLPTLQVPSAAQHPAGQLAAVHLQAPRKHSSPAPQAAAPPHTQAPEAEQPSALVPQSRQAAPAGPQAATESGVQAPPAPQHPEGQLAASQTHSAPSQRCPAAHSATGAHRHAPPAHRSAPGPQTLQVAPAAPHSDSVSPGRQAAP